MHVLVDSMLNMGFKANQVIAAAECSQRGSFLKNNSGGSQRTVHIVSQSNQNVPRIAQYNSMRDQSYEQYVHSQQGIITQPETTPYRATAPRRIASGAKRYIIRWYTP